MDALARCDAEIAAVEAYVVQPGEFIPALMGWADWMIERQLILESRARP